MRRKANQKNQKSCKTCGAKLNKQDLKASHKFGTKRICVWCALMWIHDCCN